MTGTGLNFLKKTGLGLFGRQAGHFLKAAFLLVQLGFNLHFLFGKHTLTLRLLLFLSKNVMFLLRDALHLLFHAIADVLQLLLTVLESAFLLLAFRFKGMLLAENFILPLQQNFLFLSLGLLAGLFHDAMSQVVGFTDAFAGHMTLYENAEKRTGHKADQRKGVHKNIIHDSTCNMLTGKAR